MSAQPAAMAYCRWLSARLAGSLGPGQVVRLPLEWEWQLAATAGDPSRDYPWGAWDARMANTVENRLGRTVTVGLYPSATWGDGAGPLDMAGNVWEWCCNLYHEPRKRVTAGDKDAPRVLRGGSWGYDRHGCRGASRFGNGPGPRDYGAGFRLLLASPISESLLTETLVSGE
ncbi:MAG: SUMF1/EgtB/PvdO family nonheme iron enzyme [Betaproteobacteria bacterium]|nr:SUMF1/EgtB/PvdO family nonheme iron enzyme [Betaproteobacteria bacterium]